VPGCELISSTPRGFDNLFFIERYYNLNPIFVGYHYPNTPEPEHEQPDLMTSPLASSGFALGRVEYFICSMEE
jgi:hypothetical protein